MVISVEAVRVDNAVLLDYLTSEVAVEGPKIGSTDPNVLIDHSCTDDRLHFWMPGGSGDCDHEGNESNERNAIPSTNWWRWTVTELKRFHLRTSDVDGYECDDGDNADFG